mmetsp:Transcript_12627/g.29719  ORF Transcript_12627/g.29719 Transcript_12627/m.29719 type:complete len:323 (+) Transcript_12627:83-1051(+)
MTGSSASTAFAASLSRLGPPAAITVLLAALDCNFIVSVIPFLAVSKRMIRSDPGESRFQFGAKFATMHIFYCSFNWALAWAFCLPWLSTQGTWGLTGFHSLMVYAPSFIISNHVDRSVEYDPLSTIVMLFGFDLPLVLAGYMARELFGAHLFAPFADIFDETIVQGSMPFPSDIGVLASKPYNVGLIVNMCREYPGSTGQQRRYGVEQVWLPTQDTCAPTYESVVKGCQMISAFKARNPGKRVYVHCKGGIARASTMSLAYYVRNEGIPASEAIAMMRKKRYIVMGGVKSYPAIVRLEEERKDNLEIDKKVNKVLLSKGEAS